MNAASATKLTIAEENWSEVAALEGAEVEGAWAELEEAALLLVAAEDLRVVVVETTALLVDFTREEEVVKVEVEFPWIRVLFLLSVVSAALKIPLAEVVIDFIELTILLEEAFFSEEEIIAAVVVADLTSVAEMTVGLVTVTIWEPSRIVTVWITVE